MRIIRPISELALLRFLALLLLPGIPLRAEVPADHLFIGRHIISMEASAEPPGKSVAETRSTALAVRGEKIVWLGSEAEADGWIGPDTLVHQLGERALLPGFIDAHGHLTFLAATASWANLASPPVGPVTDISSLQLQLKGYIQANQIPAGDWVIGSGYDDSLLAEQRHPDRRDLDAVSSHHPIALIHVSGHLLAANSLALAEVGYDAETADPAGGHLRRYPDSSEPNGVLEETATYPLRARLLEPRGNPLDDLATGLEEYAAYGVTTVQDGAISGPAISLLQAAAAGGQLNLDVVIYPVVGSADLSAFSATPWGRYQDRLKFGGIKMVLDGSPQGKTAYLSQPYHLPPPGQTADYHGYPIHPDERVDAMVAAFLAAGIPILAHANGDAAADQLIHAIGRADSSADHRTVMIHAQTVREDQLDAMRELGMVPSFFSAHTFFWGDWHRNSVLGPDRGARISPTRSTLDRGMPFTVHNDAPIVPPDMVRLLWATVNRLTRSGVVLGPEQRIATRQALAAMTRHAAYQYFEEDRKGTLRAGKQADLVILSRNPLEMATTDLLSLEVMETWSRGAQVFQR